MKFTYHGRELEGFDHPYNSTMLNERAIELAIVFDWFKGCDASWLGLEVGNVLNWYGFPPHRVVDLYEWAPDVENVDVLTIFGEYTWITAISTLEHVMWDKEPRDPDGAQRALEHLRSLLAPNGRMLITVPAGYHSEFDEYLKTGAGADRACTMVRADAGGWEQSETPVFKPYGATTSWAESVWIGEYGSQATHQHRSSDSGRVTQF